MKMSIKRQNLLPSLRLIQYFWNIQFQNHYTYFSKIFFFLSIFGNTKIKHIDIIVKFNRENQISSQIRTVITEFLSEGFSESHRRI